MKKSSRAAKARHTGTRRLPVTRRSAKAGLPPGAMVHVGERKMETSRIRVMEFAPGGVREHTPADVGAALAFRGGPNPVWINVYGLHDVALIERLGAGFGVGGLTLEDIVNTTQPPHVEFHDDYVFIVLRTIKFEPPDGYPRMKGCEDIPELDIDQISMVLGRGFVMCFHEEETDRLEAVRLRVRSGNGYAEFCRPDYLAYAVIDNIVDNGFAILETLGDSIEGLESGSTGGPDNDSAARIHLFKRQLLMLRRAIWPSRGVVYRLSTERHSLISQSTIPFLRDVTDHVIQMIETLDTQREVLTGILEVHLSSISLRMNEVMKILTIISTIFIPLTFIAGIYGMNFSNMPEIESEWGYPLVWCGFIMIAGGMLLFFSRKKWI